MKSVPIFAIAASVAITIAILPNAVQAKPNVFPGEYSASGKESAFSAEAAERRKAKRAERQKKRAERKAKRRANQ